MTNQTKAFLYAGLTVLSWSTVSTAFKLTLTSITPLQLIYISMGSASLLLLAVSIKKLHIYKILSLRQWAYGVLLGLLLFLYYVLLFSAYSRLPAQITQPINNTWALMLPLLAAVILKQRLSAPEFMWMLLAYGGVVLLSVGGGSVFGPLNVTGLICAIASTVVLAAYWLLSAKSTMTPLTGLLICFVTAFFLSVILLLFSGQSLLVPFKPLLGGIYVGFFELGFPFLLWTSALRLTTSIARISTFPFIVPFLALFWIHMIIHEPIAWTTILGLCLIVGGTFMQQRAASRKNPDSRSKDSAASRA